MADTFNALRQRAGPQDRALLDQLSEVTSRLARLVLNGPQGATPEEHQGAAKVLEERKEELEVEISRRSAEFRTQSRPVTLEAVEAATPARVALVEFAAYRPFDSKAKGAGKEFGETRYAVYVVRGWGAVQGKDLGTSKEIDAAVDALRQALRDYSQFFFGPLPGVGAEVRALKGLLPQATFLIKEQATKAALKRVGGPSILHIATHGFFLSDGGRVVVLPLAPTMRRAPAGRSHAPRILCCARGWRSRVPTAA